MGDKMAHFSSFIFPILLAGWLLAEVFAVQVRLCTD